MQQLTRKWWKRGRKANNYDDDGNLKCSLSIPDDNHPLDIQDQEQIVRDFEKTHACQSRLWRSVFGGFLFSYAVFLLYSTVQQAWYPWELRYHAYFMDEIHSSTVIVADLVAVIACLLAVKGLLQNSSSYQQWMWYSCYTGLLLAVFWLYYMTRLPKFRWEVAWLPFGPLSGAVICLYVDHLLKESLEDIRKLRGCMYNFKAM